MQIANNSMSRRRFLAVAGGTAAVAGLTMAGCSGNSSEPHLHFHVRRARASTRRLACP